MASKYLKLFPVPEELPIIMRDFSLHVLKYQPEDIIEFGTIYFEELLKNGNLENLKKIYHTAYEPAISQDSSFPNELKQDDQLILVKEQNDKIQISENYNNYSEASEREVVEIENAKTKFQKYFSHDNSTEKPDTSANFNSFSINTTQLNPNMSIISKDEHHRIDGRLLINVINAKGRNLPFNMHVTAKYKNSEIKTKSIYDGNIFDWDYHGFMDISLENIELENNLELCAEKKTKEKIVLIGKKTINLKDIVNYDGWKINEYIEIETIERDIKCFIYLQIRWAKFEALNNLKNPPNIDVEEQTIENNSFLSKTGGFLHYRIIEAKELTMLPNSMQDLEIYCESWLSNKKQEKKISEMIKHTKNPKWNDKYLIQTKVDVFETKFWINVWNKEKDGVDLFLGNLKMGLENLVENKDQWQKKWGKLIDPATDTFCGEILLEACWGSEEHEFNDI